MVLYVLSRKYTLIELILTLVFLAILNVLGISENLYTVITKVNDYNQAFRRNTNSTWPVKFTGTRSLKKLKKTCEKCRFKSSLYSLKFRNQNSHLISYLCLNITLVPNFLMKTPEDENICTLSFLESATIKFPSSSTVTPFGLINIPSSEPSFPRNCAVLRSDFTTSNL